MKVFDFDPRQLRETYAEQGWLHISSGLTPQFLAYATDHVDRAVNPQAGADPLEGDAIRGAKTQFVFQFPDSLDLRAEVHGVLAELTGQDPAAMVLSERHIKAYLPDADPAPLAHKDRYASEVSVGLTLAVGPDSHVVLWPRHEREVNPHLTAGLRDSLRADQVPEARLREQDAVCLHDAPGDVLVFPGSSTWHLRRNSAGTTLVYLKFNTFGSDPLGEDPTTPAQRRATERILAGEQLDSMIPVLSRGFDTVAHETGRAAGRELWSVSAWFAGERRSQPIPGSWVAVLDAVGPDRDVAALAASGVGGLSAQQVREAVRGLAERGALDLLAR